VPILNEKTMTIELKDTINIELQVIGLKAGDIIPSVSFDKLTGACRFEFRGNNLAVPQNCTVWPEDYEIVEK
jgi:hypothetical protein